MIKKEALQIRTLPVAGDRKSSQSNVHKKRNSFFHVTKSLEGYTDHLEGTQITL